MCTREREWVAHLTVAAAAAPGMLTLWLTLKVFVSTGCTFTIVVSSYAKLQFQCQSKVRTEQTGSLSICSGTHSPLSSAPWWIFVFCFCTSFVNFFCSLSFIIYFALPLLLLRIKCLWAYDVMQLNHTRAKRWRVLWARGMGGNARMPGLRKHIKACFCNPQTNLRRHWFWRQSTHNMCPFLHMYVCIYIYILCLYYSC